MDAMIFYRINSSPPRIVGTQADARREAREAKAKWEEINVPTDKTGLMAFVNDLLASAPVASAPTTVDDGQPEHKSAFTGAEVSAMFAPQPKTAQVDGWGASLRSAGERTDAICDAIDALDDYHLGNVATAVSCRFAALAKSVRRAA